MSVTQISSRRRPAGNDIVDLTYCAHDAMEHRLEYSYTHKAWVITNLSTYHYPSAKRYPTLVSGLSELERVSKRRVDDFSVFGL